MAAELEHLQHMDADDFLDAAVVLTMMLSPQPPTLQKHLKLIGIHVDEDLPIRFFTENKMAAVASPPDSLSRPIFRDVHK